MDWKLVIKNNFGVWNQNWGLNEMQLPWWRIKDKHYEYCSLIETYYPFRSNWTTNQLVYYWELMEINLDPGIVSLLSEAYAVADFAYLKRLLDYYKNAVKLNVDKLKRHCKNTKRRVLD